MSDASSTEGPQTFLKWLADLLKGDSAHNSMRESLEEVIQETDRESPALSAQERTMLANLLTFGELKVSDVMVPRADIIAVDELMPLAEVVAVFREAQHSRLPVYRETLDDPSGLVHVKDVLGLIVPDEDGSGRYHLSPAALSDIKRPLLFVPPSMPVLDLLLKMQATHTHLALVIDEYGGTDGLVSIEDIIEEIVGDISDEHDEVSVGVRKVDGAFDADARIALEDFEQETGINLIKDTGEEEIDTLGGYVISLLGRVPLRGEIVTDPAGIEIEVLEADPRRVKRLRVRTAARKPAK